MTTHLPGGAVSINGGVSGAITGGAINTVRVSGSGLVRVGRSRFVRNRAEGPENS
jgi:hypothetical protein